MILLIDIGNTLTKIAVYKTKNKQIKIFKPKIETSCQQWTTKISTLLLEKVKILVCEGAIISSVVPDKTNLMVELLKVKLNLDPIIVNSSIIPQLPIKINLNNRQIGSDFLSLAVGASYYYQCDCIVVSLGTATTYTIIQSSEFIGAIIGPGYTNTKQALVHDAALIESFFLHHYSSLIGKTTNHALSIGFGQGFNFMINGTIKGITAELKKTNDMPVKIILTGGAFAELSPFLTFDYCHNQEILMHGLVVIYNHLTAKPKLTKTTNRG